MILPPAPPHPLEDAWSKACKNMKVCTPTTASYTKTIALFPQDPTHPVIAHGHEDYDHSSWFSAYLPEEEDGCYLDHTQLDAGGTAVASYSEDVRCWWHMRDGRVLGVHDGEYEQR